MLPEYSQTETYYYLQPKEAREFAGKIEYSTAAQIVNYGLSLFGYPGSVWGACTLFSSLYRSQIANKIRDLSEKGPVCILYLKTPYGNFINSSQWDGKISSVDCKVYDYYKNGYHYHRELVYLRLR